MANENSYFSLDQHEIDKTFKHWTSIYWPSLNRWYGAEVYTIPWGPPPEGRVGWVLQEP